MKHVLWIALLLTPQGSARPQDDDNQKNTALLKIYPKLEDLTTRADKLAAEGKYSAALEIYQEAWETHPNHVVPTGTPRVLGVWEYVLEKVAAWPEAGRAAYRMLYDPRAREIFERAKRGQDLEALEDLVERYSLTTVAADALVLLAGLSLEEGNPDRAIGALERALARENDVPRPLLFAKLGEAYAQAHEKSRLGALVQRARRELSDAKVRVGGQERLLTDYLSAIDRSTTARRAEARTLEIPSWPTVGGAPNGAGLAESGVGLGSHAWGAPLIAAKFESEEDFGGYRYPQSGPDERTYRPLLPAVADGIVYLHNEFEVYAYNLFAGRAEPLWSFKLQRPNGTLMFEDRLIHTTTVHEGRVFVNLVTALGSAEDQLNYVRVKFPFPRRALFAFDAYTRELLWKIGGQLRQDELEKNASFSTAPTPEGDRLYVGAIKQKVSTDPFEHYVVCLEAATGRVLWSTFVASGLTEINLFGNSTRESLGTPVAIGGDTLYYGTNLGVFAALDKKTGRLKWAYRYPQLPVNPTRSVYVQRNPLQWVNATPVVAQGQVIFTPTDSRWLIALDASTGERKWLVRRPQELRQVYGVRDNLLVVGGEDLKVYNIASRGELVGEFRPRSPGTGRGAVAEDRVYVPTSAGLCTISLASMREIEFRAWPGVHAGGGNVTVVDGAVILTGSDSIHVFYDSRSFEDAARAVTERDTDNPALLYRAALRLFQSGRTDDAAKFFERVVARLSGSARSDEARICRAAKRRLYGVFMQEGRMFADAEAWDPARQRYERAREYSHDTDSRVAASLRLAEVRLKRKEPAAAVEVLQGLLGDDSEAVVEGMRVFDIVRDQIGGVLEQSGRSCYAAFERRAQEQFDRARQAGSPEEMAEVFRYYPNSLAAERSLLEAGEMYARTGRPDDQAAILRRFLRDFPASEQIEDASAALVRALESKGSLAGAAAILRKMERRRPDAEVADGEGKVTVREFVRKRLESDAYRKATAPGGAVKLSGTLRSVLRHPENEFGEGAPLLVQGPVPSTAAGRAFMNYAKGVKAFDLARGAEAWPIALESSATFACFHEDALVVATESAIRRVDPATGHVEANYGSKTPMRGFARAGSQICFVSSDPKAGAGISAVDATRGVLSWRQTFDGVGTSRVWAMGELAVFLTASPNRIYAFETETGKRVLAQDLNSKDVMYQVLGVTESILVVWSEGKFIEAYELPRGHLAWRKPLSDYSMKMFPVTNGASLFLIYAEASQRGPDGETCAAVIDLKTGKLKKFVKGIDLGDPRYAVLDEERAYVVSRDPEKRDISVREISLGTLQVGWTYREQPSLTTTLHPPTLTRDHLVLFMWDRNNADKFNYSWELLDKQGKMAQNKTSEYTFDRPPNYLVANDALIVSVDSLVEVFK